MIASIFPTIFQKRGAPKRTPYSRAAASGKWGPCPGMSREVGMGQYSHGGENRVLVKKHEELASGPYSVAL